MKQCPNGHEVNDDVKFCPICGAIIISGNKYCTKCGNERMGTEKFCSKCGTPFDGMPPSPQPIPQPTQSYDAIETSTDYKKITIPIVIGVIVLTLIGGGWWYYRYKNTSQSIENDSIGTLAYSEKKTEKPHGMDSNSTSAENSFVGKVYKGSGNGGGLGIDITITFLNGKECMCVSDWYRTYSTAKQIRCPYDLQDNHVVIHVNDDGTKYDLDFQIMEGGKVIGFDNSDPSIGGSMGNDYLSLKLVDGNSEVAKEKETPNNSNSYSSSNASSSSRSFYSEQIVIGYLANQSFRSSDGFTIKFDGSGRMYAEGDFAGVVSVLRYNSTSALLRYGGGQYTEGKFRVDIIGDKLQLTDPVDGSVYYQR